MQRAKQPAGVNRDHDDKQRQRQHKMYGGEYLDYALWRAPVQIVDVENDPFQGRRLCRAGVPLAVGRAQVDVELLQVTVDLPEQPSVLLVGQRFAAVIEKCG
jgi:hypothetical protein